MTTWKGISETGAGGLGVGVGRRGHMPARRADRGCKDRETHGHYRPLPVAGQLMR